MPQAESAISLAEAARRLGISIRTLHRMLDEGEIRGFKVRGQWRIRESEMERIMSGGGACAGEQGEEE